MNHIPFEVVPGITSPLSVPAYNGIPVTHRDFCSSLHIITGHKRAGKPFTCDFEALVRTKGTLVFLMGITALEDICNGLLSGGIDPDMPAAVLQQGTTAGQKRVVATVATLKEEVERQGIETPAIIVVGKVCALSDRFNWYEKLPLFGMKLVVTRPRDLVSRMADKLRKLGAEVLELPAIATQPISDNEKLKAALDALDTYQWIAFTSPTGVKVFFGELHKNGKDIRALGQVKIASIGKGTTGELTKRGLYPDLVPEIYDGEHLGQKLAETALPGDRILIPRAELGNQEIIRELEKRGDLSVTDIATYTTTYTASGVIDQKDIFEGDHHAMAVFTSASTVRGFAKACEQLDFSKVKAACIGRQTAAAAKELGMETFISKEASMDSLVELICTIAAQNK
jgi:uroporphyrinogen III methyltransferase/synthase